MKKLERGTTKYYILEGLTVAVCGMIIYPVVDLILCNFITNSVFHYSVVDHIVEPIFVGLVFAILSCLFEKTKSKK